MKRLIIRGVIVIISLFIILIAWFGFFGPERYYVFDPYIDTEMAPDYTPEKFDKVQLGMNKSEIIRIIGPPLFSRIDTTEGMIIETFDYTNDGKILHQKMPWYMCNDYAWYRSTIEFNSDNQAININKGWSYD
ncbi:MAG: outer membrane protein assembly factor BamE [Flavobacteriales bacterium]|nr:outer membrane protein assembly factor BamE [Flavobacteriales bacterium]